MKKIISIILAIVTAISLFTFMAGAEEEVAEENLQGEHPWKVYLEYGAHWTYDVYVTLYLFDNKTQRVIEVTKDTEGAENLEIKDDTMYSTYWSIINSNSFETDRYIPISFKFSFKASDEYLNWQKRGYGIEEEDEEYVTYSMNDTILGCRIIYDGKVLPINVSIVGYTDEDEKAYNVGIEEIHGTYPIVSETGLVHFVFGTKNEVDGTKNITYKDKYEGSFLFVNECFNENGEHDFGEWTTDDTVQNCLNQSLYVRYCKQCGKEETKYVTNECTWVRDGFVAPTCKLVGYKTYTCSICGKEKVEYLDKLEHNYGEWTEYPATCTTASYKTRACKNCDYIETVYSGKANGHNYEVESIVEPTCDTYGYCIFKCKDCNDTYINIINKITKEEPIVEETTEEITEATTTEETTVIPEQTTNIVEDTTVAETKKTIKNIFDYIADFFKWLMSLFN